MKEIEALSDVEFRFTEPEDVAKYGDRWFRYSEKDLIRKPALELAMLEMDLQMTVVAVMNGMRMSTVLGDTAAAWLGVRAADPKLAGEFSAFNPRTMLIEWREAADDPEAASEGKDQGSPAPDSSPTEQPSAPIALLGQEDSPASPSSPGPASGS